MEFVKSMYGPMMVIGAVTVVVGVVLAIMFAAKAIIM